MERNRRHILIFEVAGQRHALPAADVQELLPAQAVMPVPDAAPAVEGMINLRGVILPVLDVRKRFGLAAKDVSLSDHFIVVRHGNAQLALHVDHALDLMPLDDAAVADTMSPGNARPVRVAQVSSGLVLLHDVADFFAAAAAGPTADTDLPSVSEAAQEAAS